MLTLLNSTEDDPNNQMSMPCIAKSMEVMAHSSTIPQAPNPYIHTNDFQSYHDLNTSSPFNHNGSYQASQGGQMPINMTSQQNVPPTFQYMGSE